MTDSDIYRGFADLVVSFSAQQGLSCEYPGLGFDPPSSGPWLELQWFPNETQNYGMADTGPSLLQGFAQLSACYRPPKSILTGSTITDAIIAAFGKGTSFAGMRVYRKPWVSSVIIDADRIMHPVTIMWRGFDR